MCYLPMIVVIWAQMTLKFMSQLVNYCSGCKRTPHIHLDGSIQGSMHSSIYIKTNFTGLGMHIWVDTGSGDFYSKATTWACGVSGDPAPRSVGGEGPASHGGASEGGPRSSAARAEQGFIPRRQPCRRARPGRRALRTTLRECVPMIPP